MNYLESAVGYLTNVTLNTTNSSSTTTITPGVANTDDSNQQIQRAIGAIMLLSIGLILCMASFLPRKYLKGNDGDQLSSITTSPTRNYGSFMSDAGSDYTVTSSLTILSRPRV